MLWKICKVIKRHITQQVYEALQRQAAVALIGPRQVGKTTLALELGESLNALYLDLEDRDDRQRLDNPVLFFESVEDRLVILDEIHRVPEIFQILRGVIDKGRRKNKGKGRFLILGSAAIELLRQSGESLAGRIAYINMSPLSVIEVESDRAVRERLWLRGGFPDSFLAESDKDSLALRKDFIRTYLERDIPLFGPRVPAVTLERLWTMLAHRQGSVLNAAELARALEVSAQSVTRYIDLLVDLLLVRRLPPYVANVGKRLTKSPKIYIRDSGLLHALLGIENHVQLAGHPVTGMSWEGFVLENLLSVLPWRSSAFFYRTATGVEIDLLIERADGSLWAIEVKRSLSAKVERGFYTACEDLKPQRAFVVYAGDDRYPIAEGVEAISVRDMVLELLADGALA
jgi:Predicted ATPase (AAA+ superfamily)